MLRTGPNPVRNHEGVIGIPPNDYNPDPRGLGCAIFDKMKEHGQFVAQIDGITGEEETYEFLLQKCIRAAITMRSRTVTPEDVISICSDNHLNSCVPYIASLFLGAKVSCLDPELGLTESSHLLSSIRPKIIFVLPEAVPLIEEAVRATGLETQIVVFGESSVHSNFSEFIVHSEEEDEFRPTPAGNIEDTAIIFFSAGTTALPKGVCMSHRALLMLTYQISPVSVDYTWGTVLQSQLTFASLYWISTATLLLMCTFFRRIRIVYPRFDVDDFWGLLERTKVQVIVMATNHAQKICLKGKPRHVDVPHLEQVFITGAPVSTTQILDLRSILPGVDVMNLYGLSEGGGYVMSFRPHLYPEEKRLVYEKPDSCGRPRQGITCRVVDNETGEILGPHQTGELRIKSDFQMNGYYSRDSSGCWDAEGWLKSGELAYYDEDNCFFIVDRMRDMLKFRSWYVAPSKLEGILHSHPAVATAVVVGLPHPEDGVHPVGVVVLIPSAVGTVTSEDIEYYVEERVNDRCKLRGGVRIVDHIPVTPTGKNRRRDMREMVMRGEI